jgi:hypothetical protein
MFYKKNFFSEFIRLLSIIYITIIIIKKYFSFLRMSQILNSWIFTPE